jgi:hypothetical protein
LLYFFLQSPHPSTDYNLSYLMFTEILTFITKNLNKSFNLKKTPKP